METPVFNTDKLTEEEKADFKKKLEHFKWSKAAGVIVAGSIGIYTEDDLVSFGKYLLSDLRTKRITDNYQLGDSSSLSDRIKEVYHADISNWKELPQTS